MGRINFFFKSALSCPFEKLAVVISAGIMFGIHNAATISNESLSLRSLTLSTVAHYPGRGPPWNISISDWLLHQERVPDACSCAAALDELQLWVLENVYWNANEAEQCRCWSGRASLQLLGGCCCSHCWCDLLILYHLLVWTAVRQLLITPL